MLHFRIVPGWLELILLPFNGFFIHNKVYNNTLYALRLWFELRSFSSFVDSQLSLFFIRLSASAFKAGTYKLFRKRLIVHTAFYTIYIHFKCFQLTCIHVHTTLSITFIKLFAISNSQTVINSNNSNNLNTFSKSQLSLFSNIS